MSDQSSLQILHLTPVNAANPDLSVTSGNDKFLVDVFLFLFIFFIFGFVLILLEELGAP